MGSRYLTDLAAVIRGTGLVVQEEPGWETRARGSGGYSSGLPNHVMIHHTASGPSSDGQPDVNYMCYSSENRPVANLYLARSGKVWVMAAGATNTNGSGGDPCGATATDSMNSAAIGIEAGNNGTGEPWPPAQQVAYTVLVAALCSHYSIPVGRTHSHAEWAPGRKIDPAGPSRWASSGTWDEDGFRADVAAGWPDGGTTPPERKVRMYAIYTDETGAAYATDMIHVRWLRTGAAVDRYRAQLEAFGFNPNASQVKRQEIIDGVYGTLIDRLPWSDGTGDAERVWGFPVQAGGGWPKGAAWQYLVDGRVDASSASTYSKQAAQNTTPAGKKVTEPTIPDAAN